MNTPRFIQPAEVIVDPSLPARPTTCAGERAAAQRALALLLRKQPESDRPPQASTESFVDWFIRTQQSAPSKTRVDWVDPPTPPQPKPDRSAANGLPRAKLHKRDTYRIEVEGEARVEALFRSYNLGWHIERDGEVWIVDHARGYIRDDTGATRRWFVLVHTSNMRKA